VIGASPVGLIRGVEQLLDRCRTDRVRPRAAGVQQIVRAGRCAVATSVSSSPPTSEGAVASGSAADAPGSVPHAAAASVTAASSQVIIGDGIAREPTDSCVIRTDRESAFSVSNRAGTKAASIR
jgi:hypothetical protein